MPPEPEPATTAPAASVASAGPGYRDRSRLDRHAGHYHRASRRFEVFARDGHVRMATAVTGPLAELTGAEPEEVDLRPADDTGDNFLCRSGQDDPWTAVSFRRLADQRPYLYASGRVALRDTP